MSTWQSQVVEMYFSGGLSAQGLGQTPTGSLQDDLAGLTGPQDEDALHPGGSGEQGVWCKVAAGAHKEN